MNIIEHIGPEGVTSTSGEYTRATRYMTPRPGDPVDISHLNFYPYKGHDVARIASLNAFDTGRLQLCIAGASVFWTSADSVSVSGGPFENVHPGDLQPTYQTKAVRFWNWGDNSPGGGKGIDYLIERPLFRLNIEAPEGCEPAPEPETKPIREPFCPKCGSHELAIDAVAKWDIEAQAWLLEGVYDDITCQQCGYESNMDFDYRDVPPDRLPLRRPGNATETDRVTADERDTLARLVSTVDKVTLAEAAATVDGSRITVVRDVMSDGPGFVGDIFLIVFPDASTEVFQHDKTGGGSSWRRVPAHGTPANVQEPTA